MAYHRFVSYDARFEDLPFPIPRDLLASVLVSPDFRETLHNADQFMVFREYRTAATLFTVVLQRLEASPYLVATILCKRAECLLNMVISDYEKERQDAIKADSLKLLQTGLVQRDQEIMIALHFSKERQNYVQHVLEDCKVAMTMIGGANEHIAFLLLRAFELQGEVQEAFGHAVMYKSLDPKMKRDKDAVRRLRAKVQWLCGQGGHQVYKTIHHLMSRGKTLFDKNETRLALNIFTEVLYFFPEVLEAHEYRAQCFFIQGDLREAQRACIRALGLSQRTSTTAFDTLIKIKIQWGHLEEALELTNEWRMIDPENMEIERIEMHIEKRMQGLRNRVGLSQSQSLLDLSTGQESGDPEDIPTIRRVKRPPVQASRQVSGAKVPSFKKTQYLGPFRDAQKPKSKKELQREEWQREKERRQIGQQLEERRKEKENRAREDKGDNQKEDQRHATCQGEAGTVVAKHVPSPLSPPPGPSFPERSKKRKIRRKTKNLRARREALDDDSDASSVCSISTCPGDLDLRRDSLNQPRMPIFEDSDIDQGAVSDQPKSLAAQDRIRRRPPGVHGAYLLCRYYKRTRKPCSQRKLCPFAHSEAERKAWEEDRRKALRMVKDEKSTKDKKCSQTLRKQSSKQSSGSRPRPLDVYGAYRLCSHHLLGRACPVGSNQCRFAHSEEERIAWEKEREKGISKPNARENKTKKQKASGSSSFTLKEWRQAFRGQCRAPVMIPRKGGKYRMCSEWTKGKCKFNKACTYAHGEKELKAWNEHLKRMETDMKKKPEQESKGRKDGDSTDKNKASPPIKDDLPTPTYKLEDLVSSLSGVTVSSEPSDLDVSLQIPLDSEGEKSYKWTVRVCYESIVTGHLQDVVLLPQHHKCYTLASVRFKCTVPSSQGQPKEVKSSETEELYGDFHFPVKPNLRSLHGSCEVEIIISFSTLVFGSFAQVLVLDFGKEAHLAVKMNIEVGSQEFLQEFSEEKSKLSLDWTLWDDGSREIVKFEPKRPSVFNNEHLIDKYKLPGVEDIIPSPLLDKSQGLSPKNYMDVMHQLLFIEEFYIRQQISSFNVQGINLHASKLVVKKDEVLCAQEGLMYGCFHVSHPITPDDAQGRLLLRNLFRSSGSVLIAKSHDDSVVYEAMVDSVEESLVILKLSEKCCKDLELSNSPLTTVDVQFHINRLPLCEMHDNIDRLGPEHFRILFPELSSVGLEEKIYHLPWILNPNLNEDQKEIIKKIAAPAIDAPPLVVFGPFGTGKTFTLNQAIRRISVNQNNRTLICTHSNSAADIHVELLDTYLKEQHGITACKPLRIYTPLRKLSTVSDTVKEYCLITDKGTPVEAFRLPTRDDVIHHRVIVSTLGMCRALFDMNLHRGFFSHILIDEAAQALETETLTPLTLAGNNTKVVFTGDHMQMSPDVFSPQARKWGFPISLQERLFYDYKGRQKEPKLDPNLILLTENYRSNERVLQFSSDMFYGGELFSGSVQPLHPQLGPLVFYAALGKEEIEENHASYRNLAEVNEVVKRVKELSDCWPEEWGRKDLKQIAVVSSYRYQVKTIRDGLRKVGLGAVDVETIENVQGKQFRALFVSTVRTFHTCKELRDSEASGTDNPYLYFLSDPKLLNTALTRAQSMIAVIGDPFSLRTVGDCQGLWEEFIKRCNDDGKMFGIEHNELEESISQSGLNVNAAEFVPTVTADSGEPSLTVLSDSKSSSSLPIQSVVADQETRENSFSVEGTGHFVQNANLSDEAKRPFSNEMLSEFSDAEKSENESVSYSDSAGDELSESDDVGNADDFAEYDNVDESVPPKFMDPIIQALKEKCEEKKFKRKLRDEAKREENALKEELGDNKENGEDELGLGITPDKDKENSKNFNSNAAKGNIVHEDIKMKTKKGKTQIFLVNLNYKHTERTERLLRQPKVHDQECLQPEYLDRLLQNDPELYRECTLRAGYDRTRTTYGELQDANSEDILIEGDTRQSFDRDVVVVKLSGRPSNDATEPQGASQRLKGKICGIRHHAINYRERQFVCTISRENPRVMYPINKTMTPIANLTDRNVEGVPIYKKIQPDSDDKAVRVDTLPLREALSGKFFFVVQYLQWRREFPYPLGIVTKIIRRGNDLHDSFKLLNAEYRLQEEFPEEVTEEVDRNVMSWSSIPNYELNSRRLVQNAFTIDPPGSKALDDALTVEKLENGFFKVGVHIADVSYFVPVNSKIDVEAQRRGTSYFRGHRYGDVLMLPTELSHEICSLLPNRDRLAVSVYLVVDQDGCIQEERELDFGRSVVRSQCRLTYAEAQKVILGKSVHCRPEDGQLTSKIKESIHTLSFLAQKRRNLRLLDGSYYHFDHADRKEDLEAHELVEEMMILANTAVGKHLTQKNAELSPLRIQLPPKTRKLDEWRENFGDCAKLSLFLRRHLAMPEDVECVEKFVVPTSTWRCISNARRKGDKRELNLLICNDNVYPQLAVAHSFLKGVKRKAEDVRAADVPEGNRKHWSLNVDEYTRFTSPIRRYLDIVAHRLLLETAGQQVEAEDIAKLCRRCCFLSDKSSKFEKDCGRVQVAMKLSKASCEFSAIVEMVERDFIRLQLLSDANQYLSPKQRRIKISHLGPIHQPELDESSRSLELKWKLRIYGASTENIKRAKRIKNQDRQLHEDRFKFQALFSISSSDLRSGHRIPSGLWMEVLNAVNDHDDVGLHERLDQVDEIIASEMEALSSLREGEEGRVAWNAFEEELDHEEDEESDSDDEGNDDDEDNGFEDEDDAEGDGDEEEEEEEEDKEEDKDDDDEKKETEEEKEGKARLCSSKEDDPAVHFIEASQVLKVADNVSVQLSANNIGGLMSPEIQLFNLAPGIDICLEHRKLSDKCFATRASEEASQQLYKSIKKYVHVWRPVLDMEAATVAVKNDDTIILHNLEVKWNEDERRKFVGTFQLNKNFCKTRQIEIFYGDYACVKVSCPMSFSSKEMEREPPAAGSASNVSSGSPASSEYETANDGEDGIKSLALNTKAINSYWVGHCAFTSADSSLMKYTIKLFQHTIEVPEGFGSGKSWTCTVEIIKQTIPSRRMISTLMDLPKMKLPGDPTPLTHHICLGNAPKLHDRPIRLPSDSLSIADHVSDCGLRQLNTHQVQAVKQSLRRRFTLIQGPPGTGKTLTGVHIAYWFAQINHSNAYGENTPPDSSKHEIPEKAPPQILYCGPSNKSVDVIAEYLTRISDINILRVYGNVLEEEEFPIPNQVKPTRQSAIHQVPEHLKHVALHHVIRHKERSPYAQRLKKYERIFAKKKKGQKRVDDKDVEEYLEVIKKAEQWVIRSVFKGGYHQIVLCTCSVAGSKRLKEACNNTIQCIVDESAMCLEPETIVPIANSKAEQVVLIGDHMQLQPIVTNRVARSLGLSKSLFERYSYRALMLEEQYRMHEDICEFPSTHFYGNRLQTANSVKEREENARDSKKFKEFWPCHTEKDYVPLVFCNVVGEEEELVVSTEEGNERSKSNLKEKEKVVEVIRKLRDCGVNKNEIVVLSPYRAQCHIIQEDLDNQELTSDIPVMSIVKSQGSESNFVIISLVRSLPDSQIDHEPNGGWLREKLGFVTDEHQINVALTRAKRGLCIIGNKNLLEVCEMWYYLIDHYRGKSCLVDSDHWPSY